MPAALTPAFAARVRLLLTCLGWPAADDYSAVSLVCVTGGHHRWGCAHATPLGATADTPLLCALAQFASAKERVVQILPVYFWFAQLVCFWFTLTAISLFLPYERCGTGNRGHHAHAS